MEQWPEARELQADRKGGLVMFEDTPDKIKKAISFMKSVASMHNVALSFSGGKDSEVVSYLAKEAGIKSEHFYNVTTIDPPGTIKYCEKHGCKLVRSKLSFLDLVEKKGFPTQFRRFCCEYLKERYYTDYAFFGIRKAESTKRNACYSEMDDIYYYSKKVFTNRFFPILYFDEDDIRWIIETKQIECHPIYYDKTGQFDVKKRLGCIGCPLQGDRGKNEYKLYPKLLIQVLRRGIKFHKRMGRTENDAVLNLIYNLFYSNHGYEKYCQTYNGLFYNDPWERLFVEFGITKEEVMKGIK